MRACQASQDWREARETKEASGLQVRLCHQVHLTLVIALIYMLVSCMNPYGGLSVQVSQVDLVKRVLQGFQGLQETLVVMVGLVRNKSLHVIHTSYFMDMFTLVQSMEL